MLVEIGLVPRHLKYLVRSSRVQILGFPRTTVYPLGTTAEPPVAARTLTPCEKQEAWVTLVTSSDYVAGAVTLAHSLRQHAAPHRPLLCMVTDNLTDADRKVRGGHFDT